MDGHVRAFGFFCGRPRSVLHGNDLCAGSKIQPDGTPVRAALFSRLQSP
jgi:transposase